VTSTGSFLAAISRQVASPANPYVAPPTSRVTGEINMFSVIFEVHPRSDQWDAYLGYAKMLRPELQQIDGFVDNIRYRSLTREGWILSLSGWRDEKALVRWRTLARHHEVQEKGREEVLLGYHLRVGQVTSDTRVPEGQVLREQRLDETEVGDGTTIVFIDSVRPPEWVKERNAEEVATWLGLNQNANNLGRIRCGAHSRRNHPADFLER
jgi:heme-degrading monooxygenase HmoA